MMLLILRDCYGLGAVANLESLCSLRRIPLRRAFGRSWPGAEVSGSMPTEETFQYPMTQRAQYGLSKQYTLNHIVDPYIR